MYQKVNEAIMFLPGSIRWGINLSANLTERHFPLVSTVGKYIFAGRTCECSA